MIPMKVRGKESKTLGFVTMAFTAVFIKYLVAGVNLGSFGVMPEMTATEFGSAVGMILAIWLGREWTEKRNSKGE